MRCKCCNSGKTSYTLGDWYCKDCVSSIKHTIADDRSRQLDGDWGYYVVNKDRESS